MRLVTGISSFKLTKKATKQVINYLNAAKAFVNAQHMLAYYLYIQNGGQVSNSENRVANNDFSNINENMGNTISNENLYPEVKIGFSSYSDASDYIGDYTMDEFLNMYSNLKDREDVAIFLNVYSDTSTIDVTYSKEFSGTVADLINNLPVTDLRSTYIEITDSFTGTGYELHVSGNLNHITFDDFISSTEYGKHLLENAGLSQ